MRGYKNFLSPEIRIISYIAFIISLFIIQDTTVYLFIFVAISLFLIRIPFQFLTSGWLPISLFLLFTFISNMIFQHGRILCSIGPIFITEEVLTIASMRTMRVFFMIAGAKILTATTSMELLVGALGNILKPLGHLGIPVVDFFSTMGLTMKSLPRLKDQVREAYKEKVKEGNARGFWGRIKLISMLLMPLFVKSIQSPEGFFENDKEKN